MNILLTGGAGYIGSHTAVVLLEADHKVVLLDNLANSHRRVIGRLEKITGANILLIECDVRDTDRVREILEQQGIDAVIHFAGLKAVGESVQKPIDYYANNVQGTISLLQAMADTSVRRLIFSSSATVYGDPQYLPIDETHPTNPANPYGHSKLHVERMLHDLARSDSAWRISCLRYFNPVGAHDSGLIGEKPNGIPNNLMPCIVNAVSGRLPQLNIFGNDYDTNDGTGVRDYIHVMDLAEGHRAALDHLGAGTPGLDTFNLGTGKGFSVLEVIETFEAVSHKKIPYRFVPRRAGDVGACYAKAQKAATELGWKATRTIYDMCESAWRFQNHSGPRAMDG
uniref:UDP-glucose 4-epimerase n=1 Tax=Candidatus Kentrum sp. DK TaxID=2126562 RepID=A0A450STA7_9GAMM|nr:MAG: UDP-galactose 4-epimerase [Candidatus Kentron sp. DK]